MCGKFQAYGPHPIILTNVFPSSSGSQQQPSQSIGGHHQVGLPIQSSTSSIPSIIYQGPYTAGQTPMQMVSTGGLPAQGGGYTLPPTAAYFPMATYATLQQQHQHTATTSMQGPTITDHSSDVPTPSNPASTLPMNAPLSSADTAASSATKSIEGTPSSVTTQPNTPDLLIHRRQVSFTCITFYLTMLYVVCMYKHNHKHK